jgi:hypothetical protein
MVTMPDIVRHPFATDADLVGRHRRLSSWSQGIILVSAIATVASIGLLGGEASASPLYLVVHQGYGFLLSAIASAIGMGAIVGGLLAAPLVRSLLPDLPGVRRTCVAACIALVVVGLRWGYWPSDCDRALLQDNEHAWSITPWADGNGAWVTVPFAAGRADTNPRYAIHRDQVLAIEALQAELRGHPWRWSPDMPRPAAATTFTTDAARH